MEAELFQWASDHLLYAGQKPGWHSLHLARLARAQSQHHTRFLVSRWRC
jgi:hypothetical protein